MLSHISYRHLFIPVQQLVSQINELHSLQGLREHVSLHFASWQILHSDFSSNDFVAKIEVANRNVASPRASGFSSLQKSYRRFVILIYDRLIFRSAFIIIQTNDILV